MEGSRQTGHPFFLVISKKVFPAELNYCLQLHLCLLHTLCVILKDFAIKWPSSIMLIIMSDTKAVVYILETDLLGQLFNLWKWAVDTAWPLLFLSVNTRFYNYMFATEKGNTFL